MASRAVVLRWLFTVVSGVTVLPGCAIELGNTSLNGATSSLGSAAPKGRKWACPEGEELTLFAGPDGRPRLHVASQDWVVVNSWQEKGKDGVELHFFTWTEDFYASSSPLWEYQYGTEYVMPNGSGRDAVRRDYRRVSGHAAGTKPNHLYPVHRLNKDVVTRPDGASAPDGDPLVTEVCWAPDGPLLKAAREQGRAVEDLRYFGAVRHRGAPPKDASSWTMTCRTSESDADQVYPPLPPLVFFRKRSADEAELYFLNGNSDEARGFRTESLKPDEHGLLISTPYEFDKEGKLAIHPQGFSAAQMKAAGEYAFYFEIDGTGFAVLWYQKSKYIEVFPSGDLKIGILPPKKTAPDGPLLAPGGHFYVVQCAIEELGS